VTSLLVLLLAFVVPQAAGSVAGTVIDAETKAPVDRARVLLARTDGPLAQSLFVLTDEAGRFSFDDYVRGEHGAAIAVAGNEPTRGISVTVVRMGVISGRVVSEHGEPVAKVFVRALQGATIIRETRTNDLGEYRLFSLPPGAYVVGAERYRAPHIDGTTYRVPTPPCPDCRGEGVGSMQLAGLLKTGAFIAPSALTQRTYPAVYFPGTIDLTAGQPIEVRPGAEIYGINLHLVVK
jgi:hypothetical protein